MKRRLGFTLLALVALYQGSQTLALAVSLEFVPMSQTVASGQPVNVDVVISGLGPLFGPPSVGAFDLDVSFNPAILSPTQVAFGEFLGNPNTGEALTVSQFTPGVIDFAAVSLLSPEGLDALQPDRFSLAILSFNSLALGTSPLSFSQVIVADAFGKTLDTDSRAGSVNVAPEPSSLLLVASGLLGALITAWLGKYQNLRKSEWS